MFKSVLLASVLSFFAVSSAYAGLVRVYKTTDFHWTTSKEGKCPGKLTPKKFELVFRDGTTSVIVETDKEEIYFSSIPDKKYKYICL